MKVLFHDGWLARFYTSRKIASSPGLQLFHLREIRLPSLKHSILCRSPFEGTRARATDDNIADVLFIVDSDAHISRFKIHRLLTEDGYFVQRNYGCSHKLSVTLK